jgi:non-reducing end alpha-L-arabinofuranosidase
MKTNHVALAGLTLFLAACGSELTVGEEPIAGSGGMPPATGGTGGGDEAGGTSSGGTGGGDETGGTSSGGTGDGDEAGGTSSGGTDASGGTGATGGAVGPGGGSGGGSGGNPVELPCDVLLADGHPCVAAHSTVRALVSGYEGSLYQVERDGLFLDIGSVDGYANAAVQDAFCSGYVCTISVIYDQSGQGNDLTPAPEGSAKTSPAEPAVANGLPLLIRGRATYGLRIEPGIGYRKLIGSGLPVDDEPETLYMVTSQTGLLNGCCFDYGNGSTTANNDGEGTTEALYFGQGVVWGTGVQGGPWVMADLENGLYAGWENGQDRNISTNMPLAHDFVTAVLIGDTADKNGQKGRFALYGGNATAGTLSTMYDGIRPERPGYVPMQKQGGVILGIGSDNSNSGSGRFYEGVIATGAASKETADALQTAIVAAGYGAGD